ncbi:hypothetical protein HGRIS_013518, partial [Hohenbuehelia grisea]
LGRLINGSPRLALCADESANILLTLLWHRRRSTPKSCPNGDNSVAIYLYVHSWRPEVRAQLAPYHTTDS